MIPVSFLSIHFYLTKGRGQRERQWHGMAAVQCAQQSYKFPFFCAKNYPKYSK